MAFLDETGPLAPADCVRCQNGDVCITHASSGRGPIRLELCNCDTENKSCPCPTHERPCRNCKGTGDADHGHYAPGICSRCGGSGIEPPFARVVIDRPARANSADGFCPECGTRIKLHFDVRSGRWLCGPCYGRAA
jgi:hypothetical protein